MLGDTFGARLVVVRLFFRMGGVASMLNQVAIENAVNHQIGVAANRGSEMRIVALVQTVVSVGRGAVTCLLEAAQELGAQRVSLRMIAKD